MNLPNKLTVLRVILIPFFVASLMVNGGTNETMRIVAAVSYTHLDVYKRQQPCQCSRYSFTGI